MEEHISSDALPGEDNIISPDGNETGSVGLATLLKEELGKDFKDNESALKYLRDNDSYVGKARNYNPLLEKLESKHGSQDKVIQILKSMSEEQQVIAPTEQPSANTGLSNEISALKVQVKESNFYADNPTLKPYKDVIRKFGSDPAQVLADVSNKSIIDKMMAHDEVENSKSVIHSNSRLGAVVDKQAKARELLTESRKAASSGDSYGAESAESAARQSAVGSVIDAFSL